MSIANVISKVISTKHYRYTVLAIALLIGVAAPVVAAPSASAVGGCPTDHVCLYQHKNYGGSSAYFHITGPGCFNVSGFMNNQASSLVNNTSRNITYANSTGCDIIRDRLTDGPYSHRENLANNIWDWESNPLLITPNDKISSFRVY